MEDKVMKNASPRNKNLINLLYFSNTPKPHCMYTMRFFPVVYLYESQLSA